MSFGFDNIPDRKGYLRQPGLQTNAKFIGLTYGATEAYEYFDIEFETSDGKMFRERTFGPDKDKVYPKAKYENGVKVGDETKEEAFQRVQEEISRKLYYLGLCFVKPEVLRESVKGVAQLKQLVGKVNEAITGNTEGVPVNFLTIWKNSDVKQKSNLIIADRIKWCEATKLDSDGKVLPAGIQLTAWQITNSTTEKYPYQGSGGDVSPQAEAAMSASTPDLPF